MKEVFLDSETTIGLISTPPGPYPQEAVVPPNEMAHIRDEINRLAQSQRMLAHGLATPQLGTADLDFMAMQAETLKVDAWKCYTGSCPKGFDRGWWMDDERIAYPMLEQARKLNIKRVCVHKGLPLGPVPDYNHPKDLIKAARDFPDIDFLVYHSGLKSAATVDTVFAKTGDIPWTTEFCRMKQAQPGIKNIYMELGSTFAQLVTTHPAVCAHLLGQIIEAFGVDHVLWGTDSIWYGSPQWQIEAFRRFQIPDQLIERHRYQPLTRQVKERIFGLNAARVFDVDVKAKRNELQRDVLGQLRDELSGRRTGTEPQGLWLGGDERTQYDMDGGHGDMKSEILYPGAFPMVRVDLAAGENIKAESGAMVACSPTIDIESKMEGGFLGALSRKFLTGEKFFFQTCAPVEALVKHCWPQRCRGKLSFWNSMV